MYVKGNPDGEKKYVNPCDPKALGSRRDKYECQTLKNIEKILEFDTSQIFAGPCTVNSTLGKFRTNRDEFYSFTGNLHFS